MRRLAAAILAASCASASSDPSTPVDAGCTTIALQDAFGGTRFDQPLLVVQAPGDLSRFFVVEKRGRIRAVSGSTVTTFLDLSAKVNSAPAEAGMLGLAFHPDWQRNHVAFVSYTAHSQAAPADCQSSPVDLCSTLSRISSTDGGATLNPTTEQRILTIEQPFANHNGGHVVIGPDRLLYFGLGDGGSGGDPFGNAQNLGRILGKLLRLDPNTGAAAPSNPFVDT